MKRHVIIVPSLPDSIYRAPYTLLLVTYYAPGCFAVDKKMEECHSEMTAEWKAKEWNRVLGLQSTRETANGKATRR